ncbi:fatty acid desaturase [Staphylococcus xylosus]|uniref:fatty acid desaturase n=1 Tax=Staphylococcus xylosus TaxID=1288 RepID=UPI001C1DD1B8|nr:fatty acid desaturase [Staphylococcus xylosus]MBU6133539.1 fatty acid desaturase [Staphylococcus xylosus]MEB8151181.1 fatty acid desaturase [Staphylococcus xylosus]
MEKDKKKLLRKMVKPFEKTSYTKSTIQIINTIIPLLALLVASGFLYQVHWSLAIISSICASIFLIRTFIIFHDACHGSYLKKQKHNDLLGNVTGFLTFFPYRKWRREHLMHHAGSGNLEKRGIGDIWVMTVEEYQASSPFKRLTYRCYRNPFVMFVLGPFFLVFVSNRFNVKGAKIKERTNTWLNNISLLVIYGSLIYLLGASQFFAIFAPMVFISGMIGIWLFYIQHTFEDSYFEESSEWDYVKAAIDGSSYYKLPKFIQWVTGNIGYHHVHHLNPRIPNYALEATHDNVTPLHHATSITITESFASLKFKLYDESHKRFITFKEFALRQKKPS